VDSLTNNTTSHQESRGDSAARAQPLLDQVHHRGIGQCRDVPERPVLGHVAQQPPHDLARTCLRQFRHNQDLARLGDRADLVADVIAQLLDQLGAIDGVTAQDHERHDALARGLIRSANHRRVVSLVQKAFGVAAKPVKAPKFTPAPKRPRPAKSTLARPFEQVNFLRGYPGIARGDDRRYPMAVLHTILGGGMSSRLFQEVRERRSLAYSVAAFRSSYSDAGIFGVHAGCAPEKLDQTREVIDAVLHEVVTAGISSAEVDAAKNQVKGQMVLDLEDPGMRLMRLGTRALFDEKITGLNEGLAKVDAVSAHDVFAMAQDLLTAPAIDVAVGPAEVKL